MAQRLLLLGAGATGGYFGARLLQAVAAGRSDIDVRFLVRPARAANLAQHGLRVSGVLGDFAVPARTLLAGDPPGEWDVVLLACKAYDLDAAIEAVAPAVGPRTLVLPILNGLAHYPLLDTRFGAERVVAGCCHLGAALERDGTIRQITSLHRITFGPRPGNLPHARAELARLQAAFAATPVEAVLPDDVLQDVWEKYVFLAALAAMTCLLRGTVGRIMEADEGEALLLEALAECEAAARHAGHPSRPAADRDNRARLTARGSASSSSMLRDLESGGRIEAAQIVGDMLSRARAAGHPAPLLRLAWAHLQVSGPPT